MAKSKSFFPRTPQSAPPLMQQREIADQTAAFLASGGKIQSIPSGVSGQPKLGGPTFMGATEAPKTT